jgi:hypothetical protein
MVDHPAPMVDDDDISIKTAIADNHVITNSGTAEQFVVKFLFRPKNKTNQWVVNTHYAICKAIKMYFPNTKIFDNHGVEIKQFMSLKNVDEYLTHFTMKYVKGNEDKRRDAIYLVHHRIETTVSLGEIRKHYAISELLQKVNVRLIKHLWKEDETNIAVLGFFTDVDPTNFLKDEFEERSR